MATALSYEGKITFYSQIERKTALTNSIGPLNCAIQCYFTSK